MTENSDKNDKGVEYHVGIGCLIRLHALDEYKSKAKKDLSKEHEEGFQSGYFIGAVQSHSNARVRALVEALLVELDYIHSKNDAEDC